MSAAAPNAAPVELPGDSSEYKLRKQLLLLAALVVSVTYVAGLEPPGGVGKEDGGAGGGARAGAPILWSTHRPRYLSFYYCNSTALVASLVVIFLLLLKNPTRVQLAVLRLVMVLDLLGLMGAYLAGSCQEKSATVFAASLVLALSAYVGVHILQALSHSHHAQAAQPVADEEEEDDAAAAPGVLRAMERRKVVLLLATFLVAVTYVSGLNPPGGFWDSPAAHGGGYQPGDSLVEAHHKGHYGMFFYCNTTAFVASLYIIVVLLEEKLSARTARSIALYVFVFGALLGLVAAYTAGSCRDSNCSVYVVSLFGAVLAFIFLVMGMVMAMMMALSTKKRLRANTPSAVTANVYGGQSDTIDQATKKVKSLVVLLANLAATITYQAGLDPPGGFWPEDGHDGHRAGDAILLSAQPARYKAFFYCNSTAFVASVVAIVMVQNARLVRSHTLLAVMVLDMFALVGAYAAGSCRDLMTSVVVVALAASVVLYVVVQVLFFTLRAAETTSTLPEKKHKHLLLLAILVATITYQVGLTPPGGFWISDDRRLGHYAGHAVLLDSNPRHFKAFFYCNTASFMASMALILLLVNPNLHRLAIRCYPLYACQVAGLFGLIGAYAAGSARSLRTSGFLFVLVGAVIAVIVLNITVLDFVQRSTAPGEEHGPRNADETEYRDEVYAKRKYLMLLGILAASVTYQAGLAPPGGVWQDNGGNGARRREAGNSVLQDTNRRRYHVFFYSNSTSFVASVVVIALLLQQILRRRRANPAESPDLLLVATNTAVVVDLLGLLAAYAAGSTREWESVVVVTVLVVLFMVIHATVWLYRERRRRGSVAHANQGHPQMEGQVPNGQGHGQTSRCEEAT
ncbi:hypothetical protein SEVIR_6G136000v4 [Setaria viridis]|uniref:PGG domain-containing protein n=1 Tax=Setaria viridis TaxID=4556 RepID=A0A4U6U924_SETVI|nr:hypothetical protein SEVIR_6G136000v2 [Setaria viridis]